MNSIFIVSIIVNPKIRVGRSDICRFFHNECCSYQDFFEGWIRISLNWMDHLSSETVGFLFVTLSNENRNFSMVFGVLYGMDYVYFVVFCLVPISYPIAILCPKGR